MKELRFLLAASISLVSDKFALSWFNVVFSAVSGLEFSMSKAHHECKFQSKVLAVCYVSEHMPL